MMRREVQRRKRQIRINMIFFLIVVIIILLIVFLWNLSAARTELKEAREALEKVELLWSEDVPKGMQWETEKSEKQGELGLDDIIGTENKMLEKPVKRNREEIIKKLGQLAGDYPAIKEIYKNYSSYPESMLEALANNPEMADFVAGYLGNKVVTGGLTEAEKEQEFPLFLQWDSRWGYQQYGKNDCIGIAGCGPTCMSMVLFYLTRDERLTPDILAEYAMQNNYYLEGSGTIWAFMDDVPAAFDIDVKEVKLSEQAMKAELDKGGVIICSMRPGDFTASGHFVVIYGYDREGFKINDPNCIARSRKSWSYEEIKGQIKKIWRYR